MKSFVIFSPRHKLRDQTKEDEMDGVFGTYGGENRYQGFCRYT
jgi:hypothetical protein